MAVDTLFNQALLFFAILGLGALAGYYSERVGVVNIGIEGQMSFGAGIFAIFSTFATKYEWAKETFLLGFLIATLCGVIISLIFGYLTINLKADHTIVGTAINLLVLGLFAFITAPLAQMIGDESRLNTIYYSGGSWLLAEDFAILGSTVLIALIALAIFVCSLIFMFKTKTGLRMSAIGDNPNAVDAQGVDVNKYKWIGVGISCLIASFAGALFGYATPSIFFGNVNGFGFLALAIMIAGAWRIEIIAIISFIFSFILSIAKQQIQGVDPNLLNMLPYIGTFAALILFSKKNKQPKAAGKHFDKAAR